MSIRRVTCPACNASANVMATMTNIKCPACGAVWDVNHPGAVKPAAATTPPSDNVSTDSNVALFAGLAGGVVVLLAIAGLAVIFLTAGQDGQQPAAGADPAAEVAQETAGEPPNSEAVVAGTYREVDLPESTRKKIYGDYRMMMASSVEKKLMIPQDSPVHSQVKGMLEKTVKREITHFALLYNVTEEDIMQIVAEGDAKQWPGSKKPAQTPTAQ